MKKVILASTSPRRQELFKELNISFESVGSDYEEDMSKSLLPEDLVKELALGKATDVAHKHDDDAVVVGADTIIAFEGKVQGKPNTPEKAKEILCSYSGRCLEVITGVAIVAPSDSLTKAFTSKVCFKKLTEEEIDIYITTGEPLDKAGAFAVQGEGRELIDHFEDGDMDNIMGLPVEQVRIMLTRFL